MKNFCSRILALLLLSFPIPSWGSSISGALPVRDVDSIAFYQSGAEKYEALLADMQQARHHIHVEYFIFANDSIGGRLMDVLRQKAREGVECRLLIDGYYDVKRGYDYTSRLKSIRAEGIDIRIYKPYVFPYVHRVLRDHRKIVVIDGHIGYTGGFNVADYNVQGKPGIYGSYIDTHVRLEGPCVEGLQFLFSEHFEQSGETGFDGGPYYPYTNRLIQQTGAAEDMEEAQAAALILERGRSTRAKKSEMRRAIVDFIDNAQDSLHIQSPYLLPTPAIRRALRRALKRGVHVEVLFSEQGDTPMFNYGNVHYSKSLARRGAEVWLYQDGFQHSKVMMADGKTCMVGSVNMDYRATRWNEEVAAVIFDPEATAWLDSSFVQTQQFCRPLTAGNYRELPFSTRIKGAFANYFLSWCL